MLNREFRPVKIISFKNGTDKYGQKRKAIKAERTTDMVVKINTQTNVNNPRYVVCDYIGITKDTEIKDSDVCSFDGIECNIKYIIPSGKYNQVIMTLIAKNE